MTTKKTAAIKMAPTVSPEPDDTQPAGGVGVTVVIPDVMDADPAAPAAAAPAPAAAAPATMPGGGPQPASSIAIAVGSAGYYTGARPAETKAEYQSRMGSAYGTFADVGTWLGTAPKA